MNRRPGCLHTLLEVFLLTAVFGWLEERFGWGRGCSCSGCGCGTLIFLGFLCSLLYLLVNGSLFR